jgi:hypothetical protein
MNPGFFHHPFLGSWPSWSFFEASNITPPNPSYHSLSSFAPLLLRGPLWLRETHSGGSRNLPS